MNLRSRRNRTVVALAVAIVLILLGYNVRIGTQPRRSTGKRVSAGTHVVEHVYDGDSLRLANGADVRLVGIDAPDKKWNMYYADQSRDFAKKLLEGKTVRLELATEPMEKKYKRNLAYLYMEKNGKEIFVNAELVRLGYAYAWPWEPNWEHREEILTTQKEAQTAKWGLWAYKPEKCEYYVVESGPSFSLTHRPSCPKLKRSSYKTRKFENRLDALNCNGGAPPCRTCKP